MGLFDFFSGGKKSEAKSGVLEVAWSKNAAGKFRRLPFVELAKEKLYTGNGLTTAHEHVT